MTESETEYSVLSVFRGVKLKTFSKFKVNVLGSYDDNDGSMVFIFFQALLVFRVRSSNILRCESLKKIAGTLVY